MDGGFLSVSHITSGIWVGANVYLSDLPLLIIVGFTLVTTLIWGRVFCGYLCPFGALQDFLEWIVPKRFQRRVPAGVHERGLKVKYVVLALILIPAIAGSHVSLYQYFEPFGTVFFRSSSLVLWSIAGTLLLASAVVPRFYCRYVCPLGAALALTSVISLRRIGRVEQCDHCKVCEQHCPTGAINGPDIDFKECVRCNDCEIKLIERAGVCRHELDEYVPRLIPLGVGTSGGGVCRPPSDGSE
jgi:polyferredoxin